VAAVIILGSILFAVAFVAAWLIWPELRTGLERPGDALGAEVAPDASDPGRLGGVVLIAALVGAATIAGTLALRARPVTAPGPAVPAGATEDYGRRLIVMTSAMVGPDQADPAMRYTGSRLQCGSCHLKGGTEPGTLSLVETFGKYPRFSGRDGVVGDLKLRIQGCMTRSMNGRALPDDGPEMNALVSYIRALAERDAVTGAAERAAHEPAAFTMPDRAASPEAGRRVFETRCAICHGADGQGLRASANPLDGYLYPPLWGPDSFNDGAGMHRVLTAARFIKARMPLGRPDLTDDEAFDVAAFINVQPRPAMANLDRDYPDRSTKPVDTPYGPYADSFPTTQHQLGPFAPIAAFYKARSKGQ
jgi:thiosulfate dehydrogenase